MCFSCKLEKIKQLSVFLLLHFQTHIYPEATQTQLKHNVCSWSPPTLSLRLTPPALKRKLVFLSCDEGNTSCRSAAPQWPQHYMKSKWVVRASSVDTAEWNKDLAASSWCCWLKSRLWVSLLLMRASAAASGLCLGISSSSYWCMLQNALPSLTCSSELHLQLSLIVFIHLVLFHTHTPFPKFCSVITANSRGVLFICFLITFISKSPTLFPCDAAGSASLSGNLWVEAAALIHLPARRREGRGFVFVSSVTGRRRVRSVSILQPNVELRRRRLMTGWRTGAQEQEPWL